MRANAVNLPRLADAAFARGNAGALARVHVARMSSEVSHSIKAGFKVTSPHSRVTKNTPHDYMMSHAVYTAEEVAGIQQTHYEPKTLKDRIALRAINLVRGTFDVVTGYSHGGMTADKYLTRMLFLETVAGIPGMVGAMVRHTKSLRTMTRDHGYIHTLLEECENERMHLLTFLELKQPGAFMRAAVLVTQGIMFNAYLAIYLLSPASCHRFVGYLEQEAVATYTACIADVDAGKIPEWKSMPAPDIGIRYWRLAPDATMRDLLLAVRADEAIHRDVNHVFADAKPGQPNPFL